MSRAADQDRIAKQDWAVPGSRHDRRVRRAKLLLPVAGVAMLLALALAPFERQGDVSFILDKNEVATAPERMRVEKARYSGLDDKGRPFLLVADRAIQPSSDEPLVRIMGMAGRLDLEQGPLTIEAPRGGYDLDAKTVDVDGPVRVAGPDGYRLETRDVGIDLGSRRLASRGPVEGATRLGRFSAAAMSADLGERKLVLSGGARLKIVQGAVR